MIFISIMLLVLIGTSITYGYVITKCRDSDMVIVAKCLAAGILAELIILSESVSYILKGGIL